MVGSWLWRLEVQNPRPRRPCALQTLSQNPSLPLPGSWWLAGGWSSLASSCFVRMAFSPHSSLLTCLMSYGPCPRTTSPEAKWFCLGDPVSTACHVLSCCSCNFSFSSGAGTAFGPHCGRFLLRPLVGHACARCAGISRLP